MPKDKKDERKAKGKDKDKAGMAVEPGHHGSTAHGLPARVDTSLPGSREELLELHRQARATRNAALLGSDAFREAVDLIGRIEVRVAAIDRAQDPPLG
jgi:hypothetical protein